MPQTGNFYLRWADEAANNALSLAEEAQILLDHDKQERAYYLSHMANEESTKAFFLKLLPFMSVPESEKKRINDLLRQHSTKIDLLLDKVQSFAEQEQTKRAKEVIAEITNNRKKFARHINDLKNNTMYVSLFEDKLIIPAESIKEQNVQTFVDAALHFARWVARPLNYPS